MGLVPVDHDPFSTQPSNSGAPRLVPVDHDPFAKAPEGMERVKADAKQLGVGTGEGFLEGTVQAVPFMGSIQGLARGLGLPGPVEGTKKLLSYINADPDQYPAQNFEQRVARTTGNILGNPLTYGPGAARNVALALPSALGSEAAGEIPGIKGTRFEGPAKVLGGLGAPAAASLTHRAIAPRPVNPEDAAAAQRLRDRGIETSAGEVTGTKTLQYAEAEAGRPYQEFKNAQQTALTNAGLEPIAPTADQLTQARGRARTPQQLAQIDEWERATRGGNAHDAVEAARPMIGDAIEHAARNLDVHSDSQLVGVLTNIERRMMDEGFPVRQEGPNAAWASDHPTVQRLMRMRDNVLAAFDLRPGPRPTNPSWTGTWGNSPNQSTATIRPTARSRTTVNINGQQTTQRGGRMFEVLVDGQHENMFNTRADAERYIRQFMVDPQPVVPPGRLIMNGRAFHNLIEHNSALSRAARSTSDSDLAFYANQIRSALMDAAERTGSRRNTVPGTGAHLAYERFAQARRQWANLLALEDASSTGRAMGRGELNPVALRRAATFRNKTDYARGRGDFNELARDANRLIMEPPNSGSPGRLRLGARAVGSALGTGIGGLLGMGAGPWGAVAGAGTLGSIGAAAAPVVQSRFIMRPRVQQYLRSGAFQPPDRQTRRTRMLRHAAPLAAHQMANPYRAEGGAVDTPFDDALNYPPQGSEFPPPPRSRMDQAFDKSIDRWSQLAKDTFFAPARAVKDFNEHPTFSNALGVMPMGNIGKVAHGQRMQNFWRRLGPEDARLSGEPGRAVDSWVGGPHNAKELGITGGLMVPSRLEGMSPESWAQMSQPVRQIARESFGDMVPVYRGIGEGGQSHGRLNRLSSYTTDRGVAEYFAGVRKDRPLISDAAIAKAERTLAQNGEVTVGGTTFRPSEHDYSGRGYLDMYDRHGNHITDTESLRAYLNSLNAERAEWNAKNASALGRVHRFNLPIDDIVWGTDRFNQNEIIGRSNPYRP